MKKLTLKIDDLQVDSFSAVTEDAKQGTVAALEDMWREPTIDEPTCPGWITRPGPGQQCIICG